MIDYFLKFLDKQQALELMQSFTYTDEEGNTGWIMGCHQWALWEVGEIPDTEGYHLNLRVIDQELDVSHLEQYSVTPANPVCVWA